MASNVARLAPIGSMVAGQPNEPQEGLAELVPMDAGAKETISDALADPVLRHAVMKAQAHPKTVRLFTGGTINRVTAFGVTTPDIRAHPERVNDFPPLEKLFVMKAMKAPGIFIRDSIPVDELTRDSMRDFFGYTPKTDKEARAAVLAHEIGHFLIENSDADQKIVTFKNTNTRIGPETLADMVGFRVSREEMDKAGIDADSFYKFLNQVLAPIKERR